MAHYKRKKSRLVAGKGYSIKGLEYRLKQNPDDLLWLANWPRWHDKLHHTRPTRRRVKGLEGLVIKGADLDVLVWPDGRKPHVYYW